MLWERDVACRKYLYGHCVTLQSLVHHQNGNKNDAIFSVCRCVCARFFTLSISLSLSPAFIFMDALLWFIRKLQYANDEITNSSVKWLIEVFVLTNILYHKWDLILWWTYNLHLWLFEWMKINLSIKCTQMAYIFRPALLLLSRAGKKLLRDKLMFARLWTFNIIIYPDTCACKTEKAPCFFV